jgi:hypothetical protein
MDSESIETMAKDLVEDLNIKDGNIPTLFFEETNAPHPIVD